MTAATPVPAPAPEPAAAAPQPSVVERVRAVATLPAIAIGLALLIGGIVIILSSPLIRGFDPLLPLVAYRALGEGAFGSVQALINTLVNATPLVLAGLAVGIGFKAGLFNIGGTGQVLVGGFVAGLVGGMVAEQPVPVAVTIAILAGALGGAIYGFIPGALKAFTGAHEVVSTIMLNSLASFVIVGLVNDIFKIVGPSFSRTADVGNAAMPIIFGRNGNLGIFIVLALVVATYILIYRTPLGFEIRTVGANPSAARYAGMSPRKLIILTMTLCGTFAGLAGAFEILSLGYYPAVFGTTIGFGGITVALLGRAHPVGILLAGILLGGMRAGAPAMQITAKIPIEIIDVIQGLILLFLAAEAIIRHLIRSRAERVTPGEIGTVSRTYGETVA